MSTITTLGTLTYSSGDGTFSYTPNGGSPTSITWPITITPQSGQSLTVTFGSDLTLTTTDQYFIIGGSGVTIDGAGYQVDFSGISTSSASYNGFIDGGSQANSTVKNIGCIGSGTNQIVTYISRGNFTTTSSISNCYVICGGNIVIPAVGGSGIASGGNSASISNCYVICGGNIVGGIAGVNNSGSISNCYVICGGNIVSGGNVASGGGIASGGNSGSISNCYVICGGNIESFFAVLLCGGIAGNNNSAPISNCYVICALGGNIAGGGIAGNNNSGSISNCYVNFNTVSGTIFASAGTVEANCGFSIIPKWTYGTDIGAGKLLPSSAWTSYDSTNNTPWVLSAFDTAIASSTTATSASGLIDLNAYGETFANGSVYSGTNGATFTYNAGSNIAYSNISSGIYTLGLYANDLISNLTAITFTFTNPNGIKIAFNNNSSETSVYSIVPYQYSVTNNVSLTYSEVPCFLEGTKILTDKGYISIEKLTNEHLVITLEGKKRIYKIGKGTMDNVALQEKIKDQLYVYSSSEYQQITQGDLVITGGHSILVDSFENEQQEEDTKQMLGKIFLTKNKLRLPVCLDKRSRVYEEKGEKTIYHIALEHIHYDYYYGIYANGLLVESCSQNYMDNKTDKLDCIDI